jgi:hypothetical protein
MPIPDVGGTPRRALKKTKKDEPEDSGNAVRRYRRSLAILPAAKANEWSQRTKCRFSGPLDRRRRLKPGSIPVQTTGTNLCSRKKEAAGPAAANNTPAPSVLTELTPQMTNPEFADHGLEAAVIITVPDKAEEPNGQEVERPHAFAPGHHLVCRMGFQRTQHSCLLSA